MHSEDNKEDDEGQLNIRRMADFIRISSQKPLTCRGNSEDANLLLQGPKVKQEGSRKMGLSVHQQKKDAYPLQCGLLKLSLSKKIENKPASVSNDRPIRT